MKSLIKKIKKIWNNDSRDIIVPIISIIIFIVASLVVGLMKAFILLILINAVYFGINHFKGKKSNKSKKRRKKLKIFLLIALTCFIFITISVIGFFIYIVII